MDRITIKKELKEVIEPYIIEKELLTEELSDQAQLIQDLKINSAHVVDIVLDIEEKYDIIIDDDSIAKMNTVGEAINVIISKIEEK